MASPIVVSISSFVVGIPFLLSTGRRMLNVCFPDILAEATLLVRTGNLGAILKTCPLPKGTFNLGTGVTAEFCACGADAASEPRLCVCFETAAAMAPPCLSNSKASCLILCSLAAPPFGLRRSNLFRSFGRTTAFGQTPKFLLARMMPYSSDSRVKTRSRSLLLSVCLKV